MTLYDLVKLLKEKEKEAKADFTSFDVIVLKGGYVTDIRVDTGSRVLYLE